MTRPETILASNTSSISLTQLGAVTTKPEKVIGMHFMNPPVVMQLVEIVRGLVTADETLKTVDDLAKQMGKTTILAKDYAGFIVNRILLPMINEAIYALYEGVGGVEDIDQAIWAAKPARGFTATANDTRRDEGGTYERRERKESDRLLPVSGSR